MEKNLARATLQAGGWTLFGVFLTGFVFYPPHANWDDRLHLGDVATWFAAIGTIAAVVVALSSGFSEHRKEEAAIAELRSSLANALLIDLRTIRDLLLGCQLEWGRNGCELSDKKVENMLKRMQWIKMPTFEAYRESLPKLGPGVAPHVIEAYGIILRIAQIAQGQSTTKNSSAEDRDFAASAIKRVPDVLLAIWRAHHVLLPYARPLIIAGEPTRDRLVEIDLDLMPPPTAGA